MAKKALLVLVNGFEGGDITDEKLGDGIRIIKIRPEDLEIVYKQNNQHIDRWDLFHGSHSHAIVNEYDAESKTEEQAEQEILRAFVTLRIIKPVSLALHLVVRTEGQTPNTRFDLDNRIGFGSVTYVSQSQIQNLFLREDIRRARTLWPNVQYVFQNWEQHKRLVRAIRFFELSYSVPFNEMRHILFHTGLESLLCTHPAYIGQQLKQRIVLICPHVEQKDIELITRVRGGLVHSGKFIEEAKGIEAEIGDKLERIFRACLYHVLVSHDQVEIFADKDKVKQHYPVQVKEQVSHRTEKTILV